MDEQNKTQIVVDLLTNERKAVINIDAAPTDCTGHVAAQIFQLLAMDALVQQHLDNINYHLNIVSNNEPETQRHIDAQNTLDKLIDDFTLHVSFGSTTISLNMFTADKYEVFCQFIKGMIDVSLDEL